MPEYRLSRENKRKTGPFLAQKNMRFYYTYYTFYTFFFVPPIAPPPQYLEEKGCKGVVGVVNPDSPVESGLFRKAAYQGP